MTLQEAGHSTPPSLDVFLLASIVEIIHDFLEVNSCPGRFCNRFDEAVFRASFWRE